MANVHDGMTYQDYIAAWESDYGEDETGEYGYWSHGKHYPHQVHRLSVQEFEKHRAAVSKAYDEFQIALAANDDDGMGKALADSFPHELELLL